MQKLKHWILFIKAHAAISFQLSLNRLTVAINIIDFVCRIWRWHRWYLGFHPKFCSNHWQIGMTPPKHFAQNLRICIISIIRLLATPRTLQGRKVHRFSVRLSVMCEIQSATRLSSMSSALFCFSLYILNITSAPNSWFAARANSSTWWTIT